MPRIRTKTRIVRVTRPVHRRKKTGFTLPLAAIAGFAPLVHTAYDEGWKIGGLEGVGNQVLYGMTGYAMYRREWNFDGLRRGLLPIIGGLLVHKYIGGKLGINRMLSRAGVPIIRI